MLLRGTDAWLISAEQLPTTWAALQACSGVGAGYPPVDYAHGTADQRPL